MARVAQLATHVEISSGRRWFAGATLSRALLAPVGCREPLTRRKNLRHRCFYAASNHLLSSKKDLSPSETILLKQKATCQEKSKDDTVKKIQFTTSVFKTKLKITTYHVQYYIIKSVIALPRQLCECYIARTFITVLTLCTQVTDCAATLPKTTRIPWVNNAWIRYITAIISSVITTLITLIYLSQNIVLCETNKNQH